MLYVFYVGLFRNTTKRGRTLFFVIDNFINIIHAKDKVIKKSLVFFINQ